MKSRFKTFVVLLICLVTTMPVFAKMWRVNNTLSVPLNQVDFNELKAAVESPMVLSGDIIYVEGSGIPYQGGIQIFNKKLTIIGPGYLLSQPHIQPSLCESNQLSATIGGVGGSTGILLGEGSDGTYITGLSFVTNYSLPISILIEKTTNITITRNRLQRVEFKSATINLPSSISSFEISRNLIGNIVFGCYLDISNLSIRNNLIIGEISANCSPSSSINLDGSIMFNTLKTGNSIWARGCEIAYNIAGDITADPAENGAIYHNRLGSNTGGYNPEILANGQNNVYDPYNFYNNNWDYDTDDWKLDDPSDIDTIHGAHNGFDPINPNNPVSKANLPAWPAIYECNVQPCGDTTIQVQFKVRVNN